jgi:anti-anti-sigma factor
VSGNYEPPYFELEVAREGAVATVAILGEFDIATAPSFEAALTSLEPGYAELVIDLARCTFFASNGIKTLLDLNARAEREGFALVIVKAPPEVQRIFDLTSLDDTLTFRDSPGG